VTTYNDIVETFGPRGDPILKWFGFAAVFAVIIAGGAVFSDLVENLVKGSPEAWGFLFGVMYLIGYIAPTVIAFRRHHRNRKAIAALNITLGWTLIGWVIALVWSDTADIEQSGTAHR
jgi:hypothetical protein